MRKERVYRICGHREQVEFSVLAEIGQRQRQTAQAQLCADCIERRQPTSDATEVPQTKRSEL